MANNINWGEVYTEILKNNAFGFYEWSVNAINDISAPLSWLGGFLQLLVSSIFFTADNNNITSDLTKT
jgi:hypothetical protein